MPKPTLKLDFQMPAAAWKRIPRLRSRLKKAAQATADHLPRDLYFSATATILLADNTKVRQLNLDFRGIDRTTNVLSFPQFLPKEIKRQARQKAVVELGDIALAYQYVAAEAKNENKLLLDHTTHLVIHGLLHLLGYDHGQKKKAEQMERAETQIMKILGLPNPYALLFSENKKRKA
jgi:probable rRNA maturation factor